MSDASDIAKGLTDGEYDGAVVIATKEGNTDFAEKFSDDCENPDAISVLLFEQYRTHMDDVALRDTPYDETVSELLDGFMDEAFDGGPDE